MKYKNTVLIVNNLEQSKSFYKRILNLKVIYDSHERVYLSSNIVLQSNETWKELIHQENQLSNDSFHELTFETEDIDAFILTLFENNIALVHPIKEQSFGQRIIRFYDPDGHIIAVEESMKKALIHSFNQGLSLEDLSRIFDLPVEYIKNIFLDM